MKNFRRLKRMMFLATLMFGFGSINAQTARVQVIHNSADAAADSVDVYLNGALFLDNFAFRTATPFVNAPAGVPLEIAIAPKTSISVDDSIPGAVFNYNLTDGASYVIVADGIVSPTGYTPSPAFDLRVYLGAREQAASTGNTDVLVHHGSTDAPTVDVDERTAGNIVDNLSYGNYDGYTPLLTADYILDIKDQSGTTTVASFSAPLATLSLTDSALVVVASGFLDPANNSNGPAFGLFVALPNGGDLIPLPTAPAPSARVQVIHNSADAAADSVDVYLNGALLFNNFAFRTATPYIDAPAESPIEVAIAPKNSTSVADSIPGAVFNYNLENDSTYVIIANGIVSSTGYNPSPAFDLSVYVGGREDANSTGNTDVLVHHGSTDAPTVDIAERTAGLLVNDASYEDFAGYLGLSTADYIIDVRDQTSRSTVASFSAPLNTLNLTDSALVVVASGFLNPANNSNGAGFGLWVALPSGGDLIQLPPVAVPSARVQVIHNSADAAADSVDVYLNGALLIDNFAFRTASPFIDAPAVTEIEIAIAPSTSTSVADSIPGAVFYYTLEDDSTYVIVADGIVSATGYNPSPAFDLEVYLGGKEQASAMGTTEVLVHHGSTDAPTVDVNERVAGNLVDDASYGDFAGYLALPTNDYTLDITDAAGTVTVASFSAPLSSLSLADSALVVVASGFLDPSNNSNGAGFGLWVALPSGGSLIPLPTTDLPTARVQVIHNSADAVADSVDVYLNGALLLDNFAFRNASPFIDAPAITPIEIAIAPKTSTSVMDAIPGATFNYNLDDDSTYVIVADGIVSTMGYDPIQPFDLKVYVGGRESANAMGNTDVLVHHGSTDAPTVDVDERTAGNLVDNASYGDFAGYLELATANYVLDVKDETGATTVASYSAPLSTLNLGDAALVVVASGFLDPSVNSDGEPFGLFVALPAGGEMIALPVAAPVSVEEISYSETFKMFPNPANDAITLSAQDDFNFEIMDATGRLITNGFVRAQSTIDVSELNKGYYFVRIFFEESNEVFTTKFIKQ